MVYSQCRLLSASFLRTQTARLRLQESLLLTGIDSVQRVEGWQQIQLANDRAKLIVYRAFVEAELDVPKHVPRYLGENAHSSQPSAERYRHPQPLVPDRRGTDS